MERLATSQAEPQLLTISKETYPGYPTERLVINNAHTLPDLTLPHGPWAASTDPLPGADQQVALTLAGYELDQLGRPLHPHLRDMLADSDGGVVTGRGKYWNWGPNRTVDPIIMNDGSIPKVLLIQRRDTGDWALPGGFIDGNEQPVIAAKRELLEEANLLLLGNQGRETYHGVVTDSRTTAHAWAETTAYTWKIEGTPDVLAGDDAQQAQWFAINELPNNLHGSHAALLEKAIALHDQLTPNHAIHLPVECRASSYVDGGHMSYHHVLVEDVCGQKYFIKSHDRRMFRDPVREAHSRQYLEKEKSIYDHLRRHHFTALPSTVDLIDGHTLMMNALHDNDGWHWRTPDTNGSTYVADALKTLQTLESVPIPDDFHDTILPTFETYSAEGWQTLTDEHIERIQEQLTRWKPRLHSHFKDSADELGESLQSLRDAFNQLPPTEDFVFTHHDARQANLAWHPEHGTALVDWSWAGVGRPKSDTTTLLIDLHKSGHDVSAYLDTHFSREHALTMIGFWLAHSLWPTRDNDDSVRFHQTASAVAAYDLLQITAKNQ